MTRLTDDQLQSLATDAEDAASHGLALTVAGARIADFVADHMELQAEFRRVRRSLERAESGTELMELRKALEPFSAEADNWADSVPDDYRSLCFEPDHTWANPGSETAFTVGDLRRARALNPKAPK